MAITRVLILITILTLFFVDTQAQSCNAVSQNMLQEPIGIFPNEVEGFKFFGEGKLSSLRLGVSTREEVETIFGKPVEVKNNRETYDYDSDWSLIIYYFDQKYSTITRYPTRYASDKDNKSIPKIWVPAPEYIGKMSSVQLSWKKKIPFNQIPSPDKFKKQSFQGQTFHTMYWDNYGLRYLVSDWVSDKKDESKNFPSKGDVFNISYEIECPLQRKVYIETK